MPFLWQLQLTAARCSQNPVAVWQVSYYYCYYSCFCRCNCCCYCICYCCCYFCDFYLNTTSHQSFSSSCRYLPFIAIIIMVIAPPLCAPLLALLALSASIFLVSGALRLSSFFLSVFFYIFCCIHAALCQSICPVAFLCVRLDRSLSHRLSVTRNSFLVHSKLCLLTSAILVILISRRCSDISRVWSVLACEWRFKISAQLRLCCDNKTCFLRFFYGPIHTRIVKQPCRWLCTPPPAFAVCGASYFGVNPFALPLALFISTVRPFSWINVQVCIVYLFPVWSSCIALLSFRVRHLFCRLYPPSFSRSRRCSLRSSSL